MFLFKHYNTLTVKNNFERFGSDEIVTGAVNTFHEVRNIWRYFFFLHEQKWETSDNHGKLWFLSLCDGFLNALQLAKWPEAQRSLKIAVEIGQRLWVLYYLWFLLTCFKVSWLFFLWGIPAQEKRIKVHINILLPFFVSYSGPYLFQSKKI